MIADDVLVLVGELLLLETDNVKDISYDGKTIDIGFAESEIITKDGKSFSLTIKKL